MYFFFPEFYLWYFDQSLEGHFVIPQNARLNIAFDLNIVEESRNDTKKYRLRKGIPSKNEEKRHRKGIGRNDT